MNIRSTLRTRLITGVSALALVGSVLAMTSGPARAASSFQLINLNSLNANQSLCLGILNGGNDQPAVQWSCNGHADQSWHWGQTSSKNGNYRQLVNGDNVCLGVNGGSTAQGAEIVGWSCNGHDDQYWYMPGGSYACTATPSDVVYYEFFNLNSDMVIGVSGNSDQSGASVVQWGSQAPACNNQDWNPKSI